MRFPGFMVVSHNWFHFSPSLCIVVYGSVLGAAPHTGFRLDYWLLLLSPLHCYQLMQHSLHTKYSKNTPYPLSGSRHVRQKERNYKERVALPSRIDIDTLISLPASNITSSHVRFFSGHLSVPTVTPIVWFVFTQILNLTSHRCSTFNILQRTNNLVLESAR